MTDRELLELAAKAAGYELGYVDGLDEVRKGPDWNPLTDDGDALRLAVRLRLEVSWWRSAVLVETDDKRASSGIVQFIGDEQAATRYAIVRAAAEIGAKQ